MTDKIPSEPRGVVTHSGTFHLDEVMATAILRKLGLWNGKITRTRNLPLIDSLVGSNFIIDVGGRYDDGLHLYDHHQASFEEYFDPLAKKLGVKMSSCGLIFKHYGLELFEAFSDEEKKSSLFNKFYHRYILEIDANDNGVADLQDTSILRFRKSWTLPSIIHSFSEDQVADTGELAERQDQRFLEAVDFCYDIFSKALHKFILEEKEFDSSLALIGESQLISVNGMTIVVLLERCNYYSAMKYFNKNHLQGDLAFVVHPREVGKNSDDDAWQVSAESVPKQKFKNVVDILTPEEAKKELGDKLVFVHQKRFIGVTKNKEAAISLAKKSLETWPGKNRASKDFWQQVLLAVLMLVLAIQIWWVGPENVNP